MCIFTADLGNASKQMSNLKKHFLIYFIEIMCQTHRFCLNVFDMHNE